jgi:transketolase
MKQKLADTIRALSAEGVQKANSGHPGLPMGCADIASVLWSDFLNHNPADSDWVNRDRFILSAGHGSMLIYSLLHLFGYKVSMDDLKNFRQLGSKTPGHPEFGYTHGVETTTGPLGQGLGNAVGMALAAKIQAETFNTPNHKIIDNTIYALCGDGCMMEGVASEASSMAGHLKLDNLVFIYDSNMITIEGSTEIAFTEDVAKRYEAYGFDVFKANGHNLTEISASLKSAKASSKPSLIICTTTIGKGSPNKSGTHKVHGAPLGADETSATRQALGLGTEAFTVSADVYAQEAWNEIFSAWAAANPALKAEWDQRFNGVLPTLEFPKFEVGSSVASRKSSETVLNAIASQISYLYGGSADLDCSNLSRMAKEGDINTGEFAGRNLHFGVREHAMGSVVNGMTLFGGMRVYCSTFLVFSDYMRHAIRLASLMKLPVIYIFTHDSIFVGEDGPTHQPIEHKIALECIPGLTVIRPADANEVNAAWKVAIENTTGPTALLLSRQNLTTLAGDNAVNKGGYVIKKESGSKIDLIFMASGSEVKHCIDAAEILEKDGKSVRVVSVPSTKLFDEQSAAYKESVLPLSVRKRFAVDYGSSLSWQRYLGLDGASICLDRFGESGPGEQVAEHFGFTAENVAKTAAAYLG